MAGSHVAAFLLALDGAIVSWGAGAESLFGYPGSELLGRPVSVLVPPEQASGFARILDVVGRGERINTVETMACKDGTRLDVSLVVSPTRNGGRVMGARAVARDVTEESAEKAWGWLGALLMSINDGVYTLDHQGVIRTWSPGAERLYGYAAHEAVGLAGVSLVPGHLHGEARMALECVLAGEPVELFEVEARRKDAVLVPVSLNLWPVRDRQGEVHGVSIIAKDLTEQHLVQAALADSQVRLRENESLANIGGWVWDVGTGAVQWSEELHRIYGLDPAGFAGTLEAHLHLVHPDDQERIRSAMSAAVFGLQPFEADYRIVRPDREVRLLHGRAEVVLDPTDSVVVAGLRGIAQDITTRRPVNSELQARLGGEPRGSLDLILGTAQLLERSVVGLRERGYATEIARAARHLLAIFSHEPGGGEAFESRGPSHQEMPVDGNGKANGNGVQRSESEPRRTDKHVAPASFRIAPERAAIVLMARSNAGPITFGTTGIQGSIKAEVGDDTVLVRVPPIAQFRVPVDTLTSGNQVYDAELKRRVNARLFPNAIVELRDTTPVGATGRYHVNGELTFHGVTRKMAGMVAVSFPEPGRMVVQGEHILDMRPFGITPPTVAILRIYPEVRVHLHLEASVEN
ncbi:MAG: PAS domain S-box protein [Egibacteraceae bacterium]